MAAAGGLAAAGCTLLVACVAARWGRYAGACGGCQRARHALPPKQQAGVGARRHGIQRRGSGPHGAGQRRGAGGAQQHNPTKTILQRRYKLGKSARGNSDARSGGAPRTGRPEALADGPPPDDAPPLATRMSRSGAASGRRRAASGSSADPGASLTCQAGLPSLHGLPSRGASMERAGCGTTASTAASAAASAAAAGPGNTFVSVRSSKFRVR
jgi:hypothetical protein